MEKFRFRKKDNLFDEEMMHQSQRPPPYPGHSNYSRQGYQQQQQQQHQQQLKKQHILHNRQQQQMQYQLPDKQSSGHSGVPDLRHQQDIHHNPDPAYHLKHDLHQQQQQQSHHHYPFQEKRPKQHTNWNGLMQDLFGMDSPHTAESTHESTSSGVASDVTSVFPTTPTMTTFKGGDSNGSDGHSQDSGTRTASVSSSPKPGHNNSKRDFLQHKQHFPRSSQQQQLNGNRGSPAPPIPSSPVPKSPSPTKALSPSIQGRELPQPPVENDRLPIESPTLAVRGRKAKDRIGKLHLQRGRNQSQNGIHNGGNFTNSNDANDNRMANGDKETLSIDQRAIDPSFYNEINQCYVEATREEHFIQPFGDDRYIESHIQETIVQNDRLHFIPSTMSPSPTDNCKSSHIHPMDFKSRQQRQQQQPQQQQQHSNNPNNNHQPTYHQMHPSSRQHFTSSPHFHQTSNGFKSTGDLHTRELSNRFTNDLNLSSPAIAHPLGAGSSSESPSSDRRTRSHTAAEKDFDNIFCENLKPNKSNSRVILAHAQINMPLKEPIGRPDYGMSPTPISVARGDSGALVSNLRKGKRLTSRNGVFDALPNDILLRILSHLPTDHLCRCAQVCRQWYNAVWDNPILWKAVVINNSNIDIDKALKYLTRRLSYSTPKVCMILEKVNINGSAQLTDRGLQTVAKRCPELRYLDLQGCHQLTNQAVTEAVSRCVNLERLDVTGCPLVTCISLTESVLSQSASRHLQRIYLRYLDMTDCPQVSDGDLSTITSQCTQLLFLYLRRCPLISDLGVTYIANNCSSVRELSVSDCKAVTDLGLRELGKLGENLRYLSVAKCERVSDQGVIHIARACSKLRYLNVRGCEAVSDTALEFLAQNCQRLKSLDIGKCDITDDGLYALSIHCPNLRKLSIKSCDAITDKGVVLLAYRCRALQQLNVQDCCLSVEAYNMVRKYCKKALIEHTNPGFV